MRHDDLYLDSLEFGESPILNEIDEFLGDGPVNEVSDTDDDNDDAIDTDDDIIEDDVVDQESAMNFAHVCESLFIEPFENTMYGAMECLVNDFACMM